MRIAIVGAGLMGRWHAYYAKRLGAEVAVVVDPDLARAAALAKRFGAAPAVGLEAALQAHRVDLVHVCTPLESHAGLAAVALQAGKHVIVEKPLAASVAELDVLLQQAESLGLMLIPVHQFAFQDGSSAAQRALERRRSPALSVRFEIASAGGQGQPGAALDRILLEILPHPFSLLEHLWPQASHAPEAWQLQKRGPGELQLLGLHAGLPVSLELSLNARPTRCSMNIQHPMGAINVDLFHGFAAFDSPRVSRQAKLMAPFADSFRTLGAASLNLIGRTLKREPAYPGLKSLLKATYAAHAGQQPAPFSTQAIRQVAAGCASIAAQLNS